MVVTATEFKNNLGRYLERVHEEDVLITHYGQAIARLTTPADPRRELLDELVGCLDSSMTIEDAMAARAATL